MSVSLYVNKTPKRIIYKREFFVKNKNTDEIPYHGLICIEAHDEFDIRQLNLPHLFLEEESSNGCSLKCIPSYMGGNQKTIMEFNNGKFIVDASPFNFGEVEITAGIEKILRDNSLQGADLIKFGRFLIKRGYLSSI